MADDLGGRRVYGQPADTRTELALAGAAAARRGDLAPARALVRKSLLKSAEDSSYGALANDTQSWAVTCHDYLRDFDYADPIAKRTRQIQRHSGGADGLDFAPFPPRAWVTRADYDTGACLRWPGDATAQPPFEPGPRCPTCRSWSSAVTWTRTPRSSPVTRPPRSSRTPPTR